MHHFPSVAQCDCRTLLSFSKDNPKFKQFSHYMAWTPLKKFARRKAVTRGSPPVNVECRADEVGTFKFGRFADIAGEGVLTARAMPPFSHLMLRLVFPRFLHRILTSFSSFQIIESPRTVDEHQQFWHWNHIIITSSPQIRHQSLLTWLTTFPITYSRPTHLLRHHLPRRARPQRNGKRSRSQTY